MTRYAFVIDGPLLGYRASRARAFDPKYAAFKRKVGWLAVQAGVQDLGEPAKDNVLKMSVRIFWKRNPRLDWKNAVGALEDSIWRKDRWVVPGTHAVFWDTGEEKAEIVIEKAV